MCAMLLRVRSAIRFFLRKVLVTAGFEQSFA
jgi:hypothetical protein